MKRLFFLKKKEKKNVITATKPTPPPSPATAETAINLYSMHSACKHSGIAKFKMKIKRITFEFNLNCSLWHRTRLFPLVIFPLYLIKIISFTHIF